jgi:hypothetical protein
VGSNPVVTWNVYRVLNHFHPIVESGLTPQMAIIRARKLWCQAQDDGRDDVYAPGLNGPNQALCEQEIEQVPLWEMEGKPVSMWEKYERHGNPGPGYPLIGERPIAVKPSAMDDALAACADDIKRR